MPRHSPGHYFAIRTYGSTSLLGLGTSDEAPDTFTCQEIMSLSRVDFGRKKVVDMTFPHHTSSGVSLLVANTGGQVYACVLHNDGRKAMCVPDFALYSLINTDLASIRQ